MTIKELLLNNFTERETDFLISRIANMITIIEKILEKGQ